MTNGRPTQVSAQGARVRDLWITVMINVPTLIAASVAELLLIVALVLAVVW